MSYGYEHWSIKTKADALGNDVEGRPLDRECTVEDGQKELREISGRAPGRKNE